MSARGHGCMRSSECDVHKEVLWEFDFLQCDAHSPGFAYGNQCYQLRMHKTTAGRIYFNVCLYRMGPACRFRDRTLEWWAGLRRPDGAYYHNNENGSVVLESEMTDFCWAVDLKCFSENEVRAQGLSSRGHLTFYLRLHAAQDSSVYACVHIVTGVPAWGDGRVLMEACPFHTEFQWNVLYGLSREGYCCLVSPEFVFGRQRFRLELTSTRQELLDLKLYKLGPPEKGASRSVEWWASLKRGDGFYCHRHKSGKLDLQTGSQLSRKVKILKRVSTREVVALHAGQDGSLTVVFVLWNGRKTSKSAGICNHGATNMIARGDGVVLEEECPIHKEVKWSIHCGPALGGARYLASSVFAVGSQHYLLDLSLVKNVCLSLSLFRMGPSVDGSVRWWAGLKRGDGTYCKRIESRRMELGQSCEIWREVESLKTVTLSELDAEYLAVDECVTFFLRMCKEEKSDTADVCSHGASEMFGRDADSIREIVIFSSSKEIEWDVEYEPSPCYKRLTSPLFDFLNHCYMFELCLEDDSLELHLLSSLRSGETPVSVTYWAGLKYGEGRHSHKMESGKFNLVEGYDSFRRVNILKCIRREELESEQNGIITFFFRPNLQPLEVPLETGFQGFTELSSGGTGTIRQEGCSVHTEVEWRVQCLPLEDSWTICSPEFEMEEQRYLLELSRTTTSCLSFHLYRMGQSVDGHIWFWAGLKDSDGAYCHSIKRGTLDLGEYCALWKKVECLYDVSEGVMDREYFLPFRPVTFFFRVSAMLPLSEQERCTHESADAFPRGNGKILVQKCSSHKFVEWDVDCKTKDYKWILASPSFLIGDQYYLLELCCPGTTYMNLSLYRMGPCVDDAMRYVRWWVGISCPLRNLTHANKSGRLNLKEECVMWRKVRRLTKIPDSELASGGHLTIFFWLNLQRSSKSLQECVHVSRVMSLPRVGSMVQDDLESCKRVDWRIDCLLVSAGERILASPVFSFLTQDFVLDLRCKGLDWKVRLFRRGSFDDGLARWCLGVKSLAGVYEHHGSRSGVLDLQEECEVWTEMEYVSLLIEKFDPDERKHLLVTLFLSLERGSITENCDAAVLQDSQNLERMEVVFKVQSREFREHKAVLSIRVPALAAMFHYDTVEERTGVVQIEDCDPTIFEIFLKFVGTGKLPDLSMHEVFALYAVADKFLMESLKSQCLQHIERDVLTVDTFCSIVELTVGYKADDLLETAAKFLAQNTNIIYSEMWKKIRREYPETAYYLEIRAGRF